MTYNANNSKNIFFFFIKENGQNQLGRILIINYIYIFIEIVLCISCSLQILQ